MNKYQEALNKITKTADKNETLQSDLECFYKLQELVNKETPMKPMNQFAIDFGLGNGGNCSCGADVNYQFKYCPNCGQHIDWSEDE